MSELNASNLRKEHGNEGPDLVGVTELTSPYFMVPPSGNTGERPQNPQPGTLRFNTDIGSLEYFNGDTIGWEQIQRTTPNLDGGARGLIMGGYGSPDTSMEENEYITISTLGNATNFGELTSGRQAGYSGLGSRTSAFYAGGSTVPATTNVIDKITISSTGNGVDYADLTAAKSNGGGVSNQTRAIIAGGTTGSDSNVIEYFSMTSAGDAVDFGDLAAAGEKQGGSIQSSTRGIFYGGSSGGVINTIEYITMSTTGNPTDFGDMTTALQDIGGGGNSTRGIMAGGRPVPASSINTIQYITIATTGNAADFGDITQARDSSATMSSPTRMVVAGGWLYPTLYNIIDYVEIATTGNAVDFGDTTHGDSTDGLVVNASGVSNAHGGL